MARQFFYYKGRLYQKGEDLQHKLVVKKKHHMYMLKAAHNALGHRGTYATGGLIGLRFWWPAVQQDINWYIATCDTCQKQKKLLVKAPPVVTHTPSIFQDIYIDTVEMTPSSKKCKYILHSHCGLCSWAEARAVQRETTKNITRWLFEDIIMCWGCVGTIFINNAPQYKGAVAWLRRLYGITGITISPYNSKANARIERLHKDLRQLLAKATDGELSKWFWFLPHMLWADRITIRKRFGTSPFFLVTGTHPIIPLDTLEATWLVNLPNQILTTEELIGYRARALIKHRTDVQRARETVHKEKILRALVFDRKHQHLIKNYNFQYGNLVLIQNSALEKSLSRKMYNKWFGPCIVLRRTKGGAYICAELNGSVIGERIARERVIPYIARKKIKVPPNLDWINVSRNALKELEAAPETQLYRDVLDLTKTVELPGQ
jgi:hypothetical protein